MTTPFDDVVASIKARGYHNQRLQDHSDIVSDGIECDLRTSCASLRIDLDSNRVRCWKNVRTPGARQRKIDLLIGEPSSGRGPNLDTLRICVENKSVVTAHRNRDARFDDLNESLQVLHRVKAEAVLVATVIVGTAPRVLNVPDRLKPTYRGREKTFERRVVPRLSGGDQELWTDFQWAVSRNRSDDAQTTMAKFRRLRTRPPGHTHVVGYDYVLLIPVFIDNVNPPYVDRSNDLGIDVDREYQLMLDQICAAYRTRWHL